MVVLLTYIYNILNYYKYGSYPHVGSVLKKKKKKKKSGKESQS